MEWIWGNGDQSEDWRSPTCQPLPSPHTVQHSIAQHCSAVTVDNTSTIAVPAVAATQRSHPLHLPGSHLLSFFPASAAASLLRLVRRCCSLRSLDDLLSRLTAGGDGQDGVSAGQHPPPSPALPLHSEAGSAQPLLSPPQTPPRSAVVSPPTHPYLHFSPDIPLLHPYPTPHLPSPLLPSVPSLLCSRNCFFSYTETDEKDVSLLLDATLLSHFRLSLTLVPGMSITTPHPLPSILSTTSQPPTPPTPIQLIGYPLRAIQVLEGYSGHQHSNPHIISSVSGALAAAHFSIFYRLHQPRRLRPRAGTAAGGSADLPGRPLRPHQRGGGGRGGGGGGSLGGGGDGRGGGRGEEGRATLPLPRE